MLKAPPFKSLDLNFSVIKCHCWTYDDNIGPKFKKPRFAFLGGYNMFDNKLDKYRTEIEIAFPPTELTIIVNL